VFVGYLAERRHVGAVRRAERAIVSGGYVIPEQGVIPPGPATHEPRVGVQEHLVGIEPMPLLGAVRPINTVSIELTRADIRHEDVPDRAVVIHDRNAALRLEQNERNGRRRAGIQGEIGAIAVPRGTERELGFRMGGEDTAHTVVSEASITQPAS
jgi:hypothetical protein